MVICRGRANKGRAIQGARNRAAVRMLAEFRRTLSIPPLTRRRPRRNNDGMALDTFPHQDPHRAARIAGLRRLCLSEAATLLALLLIAVPLKHRWHQPLGVTVMGPVHGFVFLAFMWRVAQAIGHGDLDLRAGVKLGLAACVPFGGLFSWRALR